MMEKITEIVDGKAATGQWHEADGSIFVTYNGRVGQDRIGPRDPEEVARLSLIALVMNERYGLT